MLNDSIAGIDHPVSLYFCIHGFRYAQVQVIYLISEIIQILAI
jgi:hypothetical protein